MPLEGHESVLTSEVLTAKPTPDSRRSSALRPQQKKVYPAPGSVSWPSSAKRVSLNAAMSMLYPWLLAPFFVRVYQLWGCP